ncbi:MULTISPECIES: sugar phosphate isomerase/epimerase family protein [Hungatella]|nr:MULTISPECIES: sugar phosphate isomerase/epimerase [Hungatella]MCQ4827463.1 sugar phosphate isomerase/epimerase [Hungatella sp. SL.1.14]CUP01592.1 Sugar phosphate isomerases/epimerases [Hungatella hathewayi]
MKVSTSTNILFERMSDSNIDQKTAIRLCAEAGYQILDFCFHDAVTSETDFLTDRWQSYMEEIKRTGKEKGVKFPLGHAVIYDFCSAAIDRDYYDRLMERCIIGAEILGIEWLVLHPSTVDTERFSPDKLESEKANLAFFKKWGKFALKHGVGLAVEGMWDSSLDIEAKYAISVDELIRLIDGVGLSNVAVCWDFEHGSIMGLNQRQVVERLGNRLKAVHISDQTGINNIHILPYQGVTDWEEVLRALADFGYDGEFNFEIQWYLRRVPEEMFLSSIRYSADLGAWMVKQIERFREESRLDEKA